MLVALSEQPVMSNAVQIGAVRLAIWTADSLLCGFICDTIIYRHQQRGCMKPYRKYVHELRLSATTKLVVSALILSLHLRPRDRLCA